MTGPARSDRFAFGAMAAAVLAVGCCAAIPLAIGAIAAIGGLTFGAITAGVLLLLGLTFVVLRRRSASGPPAKRGMPAP